MIHFICPKCGEALEAPDELIGKRLDCPACENACVVPLQLKRYLPAPPEIVDEAAASEARPARPARSQETGPALEPPKPPEMPAMMPWMPEGQGPALRYVQQDRAAQNVQLIERTAKKWKALQLVGALGIPFSFFLLLIGGRQNILFVPILVLFASVWLYARLMAWWHHG